MQAGEVLWDRKISNIEVENNMTQCIEVFKLLQECEELRDELYKRDNFN